MPRRCLVLQCRGNSGVHMPVHAFPKDISYKKLWSATCGRDLTATQIANGGICSHHFSQEMYVIDQQQESRGLTKNAFPTLNLPTLQNGLQFTYDDACTLASKAHKLEVALYSKISENYDLQQRINQLEGKVTGLKRDLNHCIDLGSNEFDTKFRQLLSDIMTENQITTILQKKNWKKSEDEDKAHAISLYNALGKNGYEFLRSQGQKLPTSRTVRTWISAIRIVPGIIKPVMNLLKEEFKDFTPLQRQGMLCFDEVHIDSRVSFDPVRQKILGPFRNMMAVHVRGLFYPWKQLIFFDFDVRLNKDKIEDFITKLHECGINVVGIVSDMATVNVRIWKELGINPSPTEDGPYSFPHPQTTKDVWVFADFVHLLKLLRNHFVDHPIQLGADFNNSIISSEVIEKLLAIQKHDLQVAFKLTDKHIYLSPRERMNASKAFQLFSETTSKAIAYIFPEHNDCSDFFQLVNDFSDVMNTRVAEPNLNPYKSPFGMNPEEQSILVEKFRKNIVELRVLGGKKKTVKPFQKGFHLSINSLVGLLNQMQSSPVSCQYLLTSHLNTDCVESSFSSFRGVGGFNELPLPTDAINRVKAQILSSTIRVPTTGNVHSENDTSFLSGKRYSILAQTPNQRFVFTTKPDSLMFANKFEHIDPRIPPKIAQGSGLNAAEKSRLGGCEYVAGFIAGKLLSSYPNLATAFGNNQINWVEFLSRGGLVSPSRTWMLCFLKFEEYFEAWHKSRYNNQWNLYPNEKAIDNLVLYLCHVFKNVPEKAIFFYVRLRTKIRINAVNKKILLIRRERRALEFRNSNLAIPTEDVNENVDDINSENDDTPFGIVSIDDEAEVLDDDLDEEEELLDV